MGEVIRIEEWLHKRDPEQIKKRLADIALEKLLLQSEENRLLSLLERQNQKNPDFFRNFYCKTLLFDVL